MKSAGSSVKWLSVAGALFALAASAETAFAQTSSGLPPAAISSGCPAPGEGRGRPPGGNGGSENAEQRGMPPQAGPAKKRLLIWADTQNGIGQHDSIGHAEAIIEELGYKSGLYSTYIRTDSAIIAKRPKTTTGQPASGGPSLCNVDAIFFLGHREINLDATQRADLLWFVRDAGKGFVAAHSGTTAFESWPEFGQLIGGRFDNHPWNQFDGHVIVVDPHFPGVQQFGNDFNIHEEFYQTKNFVADQSHLIMRLDASKLDMSKPNAQAKDYPFPLVWAKTYGKGRVFYSAFGHADSMWDDPRMQDMMFTAIKWSLGLIDGDATPNPGATPPAPAAAGH